MGTHGPIKYLADFGYFDQINTDEKAYWLGFIAADGTVVRSAFSVSLAIKDIDHLYRLKKAMKADHPVRTYSYPERRQEFARFLISSKPLVASLGRLGITQNKTFTLCMPPIPRKWIGAFVRGYFDGDGSIYSNKKSENYTRAYVRINGTKILLDVFAEEFSLRGIKCRVRPEKRSKIYLLTVDATVSVMRLRDWIYTDAAVFLPRKKERFEAVCAPRACLSCGKIFQPIRNRGQCCSNYCRQIEFRKRNPTYQRDWKRRWRFNH